MKVKILVFTLACILAFIFAYMGYIFILQGIKESKIVIQFFGTISIIISIVSSVAIINVIKRRM